jgi:putative inorganic carbon (HCO3(-)) transporter
VCPVAPGRLSRATDWVALALPLALGPFLLFPRLSWMWLALAIPVFWGMNLIANRQLAPATPLNVLLLPLMLMVGVSLWATFSIEFSLGKIAGTLLGVLLFWGLAQFIWTEARLRLAVAAFLAGGFAFSVLALLITQWRSKFPFLRDVAAYFPPRIKVLAGTADGFNANPVGGSMLLFLPLALVLLICGPGAVRKTTWRRFTLTTALALAALMFTAVLLLSQSRGAWIGMAAALVFLLSSRFLWVRRVALTALGAGGAWIWVSKPWVAIMTSGDAGLQGGDVSLKGRFELWSRALYGIQDFPYTGMGMDTFRRLAHTLYPVFTLPQDADFASAHNVVLQTALDLGIPGMVAFVSIWAAVGFLLFRIWKRSADSFHRATALGLMAGLLAQFVYQLADAIPLGAKVGVFWWIALGIAAVLFRLEFPLFARGARTWQILLHWFLVSLVSISLVGSHPYWALAVGASGAAFLGWEAAREKPEDCHG